MSRSFLKGVGAVAVIVSACTVGPDYRRPDAPVPAQYKEAGWKVGEPLDAIDRGAWWSVYKDSLLDDLEKQIDISNRTSRPPRQRSSRRKRSSRKPAPAFFRLRQ
jgi:outer membrane protein TolC